MKDAGNQGAIAPGLVRPYISLMFLESTSDRPQQGCAALTAFMRESRRDRGSSTYTLLRSGFTDIERFRRGDARPHGVDYIDGFVYRLEKRPSWATESAQFPDVQHGLAIVLRRGKLVAVSCDQSLRDAVGKWLKSEPTPPFRLISLHLIQGAFVRGQTKGLWLRGTHRRTTFRPDSKQLSGMRLEDTLNALEDSSFAMAAARSKLPEDIAMAALLGIVGTSPSKGTMWNRQAENFTQFMDSAIAALELIEETAASGQLLARPFPILAEESHDLSAVRGAYDIVTLTPDDIPIRSDVSDDVMDAAAVLERATFKVFGSPTSADFELEVGLDGSMGGRLQATTRMKGDRVTFKFGFGDRITNLGPVREVLDALEKDDELFCVYYDSGHVVGAHGIGRRNVSPFPFPNWCFADFSGFNIGNEKPSKIPAEIHALTGDRGDTSLFGWAARYYSSGLLICDDGPGEVADFVHISDDSTFSLIHVKSADSVASSRSVAVSPFEVVASQAVKNSRLLIEPDQLRENIDMPHGSQRAAWTNGRRVPGRSEFLARLAGLPPDKKRVVIVQPHISELTYQRVRQGSGGKGQMLSQEHHRLRMLETLLHTARAAVVALGADLYVIGSKT
jgi:hypothetical protein